MTPVLATTPTRPYYAVVFTSLRAGEPGDGYEEMSRRMVELASAQPGFLGVESARGGDGVGITVSYWHDLEAIGRWKAHAEHLEAQGKGRGGWYRDYRVRVMRLEYEYGMAPPPPAGLRP